MKYALIHSKMSDISFFTQKIDALLEKGWELYGHPFHMSYHNSYGYVAQAMIKKTK